MQVTYFARAIDSVDDVVNILPVVVLQYRFLVPNLGSANLGIHIQVSEPTSMEKRSNVHRAVGWRASHCDNRMKYNDPPPPLFLESLESV